jgi:hypothetical protein
MRNGRKPTLVEVKEDVFIPGASLVSLSVLSSFSHHSSVYSTITVLSQPLQAYRLRPFVTSSDTTLITASATSQSFHFWIANSN